MRKPYRALQVGILALVSLGANGAVIDSVNIAGLETFQDTITGRVWLDMDNFFDSTATSGYSGYQMISAAQSAGFTFAKRSDVEQLLNSLPLGNNQWFSYATVMGYGIPRQLIWGMYDDQNGNPYGWAYAYSSAAEWSYSDDSTDANIVQNADSIGNVDMGIWAYRPGIPSVPVPGALWLFGSALMGLIGLNRRKLKAA